MSAPCTASTRSSRPCKAQASRWPHGFDGNPQLCGKHLSAELREIRDAGFAELERRRTEQLDARDPECWAWGTALHWGRIAIYYGGTTKDLQRRFEAGEEQALRIVFAAWHDNRCAVCGFRDARLVQDHDHETGLIRGLLCRSCNGCEPHDGGLFEKYRERPPAQIVGIRLRYYDPWSGWAQPRDIAPRQLDNHPAYALAAKLGERFRSEEPHDEPQDH